MLFDPFVFNEAYRVTALYLGLDSQNASVRLYCIDSVGYAV